MASEIYNWISTHSVIFQGIAALIAILLALFGAIKFVPKLIQHFFPKYKAPLFYNFSHSRQGARGFIRYLFSNANSAFIGREKEFTTLLSFVNEQSLFKWWGICGEGGTGKSRIALELCKNMKMLSWDAGFCNLEEIPIDFWRSWLPKHNTLLIFDYAAQSIERANNSDNSHSSSFNIHKIIKYISENSQNFKCKVRVLLLERQYHEKIIAHIENKNNVIREDILQYDYSEASEIHSLKWFSDLILPSTDNLSVYSTFFDKEFKPLRLNSLADEFLYKIANETYRNEITEEIDAKSKRLPDNFIVILESIDRLKRPLFAIMLAYSMAKRKDSSWENISNSDVLWQTLEREFTLCSFPEHEKKQCILSIALSTLTGVLHEQKAVRALDSFSKDTSHGASSSLISTGFATRDSANSVVYLPLEPDILGEFFVLEGTVLRLSEETMNRLINEAWKLSSIYVCYFFDRCLNDFPNHHRLNRFILNLGQIVDDKDLGIWLMLINNLIISNVEHSRDDDAICAYESIFKKVRDGKYNELLFVAGYNLILGISKRKNAIALKFFNELATVDCNDKMKNIRARIGSIIISACCEEQDIVNAISVFNVMMGDKNCDSSNQYIARSAFNISALIGKHYEYSNYAYNDLPEIFSSVFQIYSPLEEYADYIIKVATNIISFLEHTTKIDISESIFDRILEMRDGTRHDRLITKMAYNLSNHYVKLKKYVDAYNIFLKISTFSNDKEVVHERARILYNLIAEIDPHLPESLRISIQSIQSLENLIASGADINMWREAAVNLVGSLSVIPYSEKNHAIVKEINSKALSRFELESTQFSKFLTNYILFLCVAGKALYNIQDTKNTFSLFPEKEKEQIAIKAQCASDILLCMTMDNFDIDEVLYDFACDLYQFSEKSRHSHDEKLCTHPKTMLNMISIKCKLGFYDEAISIYDKMLLDYHAEELCIDQLTNACTNIIGYCAKSRIDLCEHIFDSLIMYSSNYNYDEVLSTASLNMIIAYAFNDDIENALRIFSLMPSPEVIQKKQKIQRSKFRASLALAGFFHNKRANNKAIEILLECEKLIQSENDKNEYAKLMNIINDENKSGINIIIC